MTDRIRVGAIDNHPAILHGVSAMLREVAPDIEVVAIASSVDELIADAPRLPDVVLLDLGMPRTDDPPTNIRRLVEAGTIVLIYTAEERPVPVRRAIEAGASGLLLKVDPVPAIAEAIRGAVAGEMAFSSTLAHALLADEDTSTLTERQVEILGAIAEGLPYRSVARRLAISESTVREHLNRAVAAYRARGIDPGNSHGLVHRARRDGHLDD